MWIICIAFLLQLQYRPYQNDTEQTLEKLSLCVITIACMVGQVILQANGEQGLGAVGLAFCRALVGCIIIGTFARFVVFFVSEVRGAMRRKHSAAVEGDHVAPPSKLQSQPDDFAVDNPLYSHRESGDSPGNAAPAPVLAQAGRMRHESTEVNERQ